MNKKAIGVCTKHFRFINNINKHIWFVTQWVFVFMIALFMIKNLLLWLPVFIVLFALGLIDHLKGDYNE